MHVFKTVTALVLLALTLAACSDKEPERTPEQQVAHDFAELAWTLKAPLDSSTECPKIGEALDAWDKANGARFKELAGKLTELKGADARNFQKVQQRFDQVAGNCVNPPKTQGIRLPQMMHDAHVARVYGYLPKTKLRFELK